MQVYTYYENIERPGYDRLISLWYRIWADAGWEPYVLTLDDARRHPQHDDVMRAVAKYPTINGQAYEWACYRRWLALAAQGGGFQVDADVMPNGLQDSHIDLAQLMFYDASRVPCAVSGLQAEIERMLDWFRTEGNVAQVIINDRPHVSDMHIVARHTEVPVIALLSEWGEMPVRQMIHFAHGRVGGREDERIAVIEQWRQNKS